jgi:tryptophan synthase alpha chain
MDGPTIQEAANTSLNAGTGAKEVFAALAHATSRGIPSVVMTYWNPIEKHGLEKFAESIATNSGSGVITPDLPVDEAQPWKDACATSDINSIFVVAPSTTDKRLEKVTAQCSGFVYAASLMGVTGARTGISAGAKDLVDRIKKFTDTPVAVGLGVSTREHAKEVAAYADGVIVGSAFINALANADSLDSGIKAVRALVEQLALGVREGRG